MMIFRAGETAGDGEPAGAIVSIPRGSRASSLWAVAKVGAVTKAAARKYRHVMFMCCPLNLNREPNRREFLRLSGPVTRQGRLRRAAPTTTSPRFRLRAAH